MRICIVYDCPFPHTGGRQPHPEAPFYVLLIDGAGWPQNGESFEIVLPDSRRCLDGRCRTHGKTADGLVAALVAATKSRLDEAVTAKHLTAAQEKAILSKLQTFYKSLVNGTGHGQQSLHGFGFGSFGSQHHSWTPSSGMHSSGRSSAVYAPQI